MNLIKNHTNPNQAPVAGDLVEYALPKGGSLKIIYQEIPKKKEHFVWSLSESERDDYFKRKQARELRNNELKETDWIVSVIDHPQHSAYLTYRQALRDWTDSADFPEVKPTLEDFIPNE